MNSIELINSNYEILLRKKNITANFEIQQLAAKLIGTLKPKKLESVLQEEYAFQFMRPRKDEARLSDSVRKARAEENAVIDKHNELKSKVLKLEIKRQLLTKIIQR
jgi:hypothetical protein